MAQCESEFHKQGCEPDAVWECDIILNEALNERDDNVGFCDSCMFEVPMKYAGMGFRYINWRRIKNENQQASNEETVQ
jgi:hypothetical protein